MLSNAYFLAKFRFDTAENEPAKNLQKITKFPNFADPNPLYRVGRYPPHGGVGEVPGRGARALAEAVRAEGRVAADHGGQRRGDLG